MLAQIREKVQGIVAAIILLLVGVPFILWGINNYFEIGSSAKVAQVNGTAIGQQEYRAALEQFRGQVDPAMLDSREFKRMVVDSLIDQTLLVEDARDRGYRLSDQRLGDLIRNVSVFQRDGRFDQQLYEALLRREGLSVREFEERLRNESLVGQAQEGLTQSGFVTQADAAAVVRLLTQEREAAFVLVGAEAFVARAGASASEIEQYYSAHPELFQTAEQVRVEYVHLAADSLAKAYTPAAEELKRAYAEEGAAGTPEQRRARHILIALPPDAAPDAVRYAEGRIRDIEKQARAGKDFAQLAKKHSQDTATAAKGGDLGEIKPGMLPQPLEDAIKPLRPGELGPPVRTEFGYHLVKLVSYVAEKRKSFEERKPELTRKVRQRRGEEQFYELTEKLHTLAYEHPDSLMPAAKALGVEVRNSGWFTRAGGEGVAAFPKLVEAAFSQEVLAQGRNSDPVEVNRSSLYAVRLLERRPAARRPLAEVRAEVERILGRQRAAEQAQKLAGEILAAARAGEPLATAAKKHGLKYQAPKAIARESHAGFDARLVQAVFKAPRPEAGKPVYDSVALGEQGVAVFVLTGVRDGDVARTHAETRDKVLRALTQRRGADYNSSYRAGLRQKAEIKVYQERL